MIIILHQKKWEISSFGGLIDIHVNSEFPLSFVQMKAVPDEGHPFTLLFDYLFMF